jgi:hypothetical protein
LRHYLAWWAFRRVRAAVCWKELPEGATHWSKREHHVLVWINQVERWFAEIQRRCLDRGVFCSLEDLTTALQEWIKALERHRPALQMDQDPRPDHRPDLPLLRPNLKTSSLGGRRRDRDRPGRLRPDGAPAASLFMVTPAARQGGDKRQAPATLGQLIGAPDGRLSLTASVGHRDKRHTVGRPDHLDREIPADAGLRVRDGVGCQLGHAAQKRLPSRTAC